MITYRRILVKYFALVLAGMLIGTSGCRGQDVRQSTADTDTASDTLDIPAPDSSTLRLFNDAMAYARRRNLHERPVGQIMTDLGERFEAKPYAAGLLDEPAKETLVCTLNEFDCVTFVESMLALAWTVKRQEYDYNTWASYIRDLRYRGGNMDGYCSRLHYFSDWLRDNEERGNVENITEKIGGVPYGKTISFMTEHRESYPRFADDDSLFQCIQEMEASLRGVDLFYVPQDRIADIYDELRAGDIIATATHLEGLDVTHTGLVYDSAGGKKGMLHASTSGGVKVSPDLQSYVEGIDSQIGIIVARPRMPETS